MKKQKQKQKKQNVDVDNRKTALYIRVSTQAQFEEGYSIEAQQEILEAHVKARHIKNYEFYIDGGYSGATIERPELQRLIEDVKQNKIGCVMVYKLDRLSRSQKDTLYLIEDVFTPHNADFISINENIDTTSSYGMMVLGVLSAFAQLERSTIRERTQMGMQKRVEKGLWPGGGRIPFGYDYDQKNGILVPNKDAEKVRQMYDLYLQGYSPAKIAQVLGLKYDRLVVQILMRKSNTGIIYYNGVEYMGQHEPIISLETYEKTMEMMKERSVQRTPLTEYLLTGLLYCGKCGAKMRYQKWGKHGAKIVCYSRYTNKPYLVKDPNCDNPKIWADEVEDVVIKDLFKISVQKERKKIIKDANAINILEMLNQQYNMVANKIKNLYNLYATDPNEMLLETIEENQQQLAELQNQITKEQERKSITNSVIDALRNIDTVKDGWEFMTIEEKQRVVRSIVDKVIVKDDTVEVHYKFLP